MLQRTWKPDRDWNDDMQEANGYDIIVAANLKTR